MNKINPLYLMVIFIIVFLISFFMLDSKKQDYISKVDELSKIKKNAKEYVEYKANWNNKNFVNNTIDKILKNKNFQNQKILRTSNNNVVKLKIQSDDSKILNEFLNRILNKKLIIKTMQIKKDSVSLDIGLKI